MIHWTHSDVHQLHVAATGAGYADLGRAFRRARTEGVASLPLSAVALGAGSF